MKNLYEMTPDKVVKKPEVIDTVELDTDDRIVLYEDGLRHHTIKYLKSGPKDSVDRLSRSVIDVQDVLVPKDGSETFLNLKIDGRVVQIRRSDAGSPAKLATVLANAQAKFIGRHAQDIGDYLLNVERANVDGYTRPGWYGRDVFLRGEDLLTEDGTLDPSVGVAIDPKPLASKGTYQEWRTHVLEPAKTKPLWEFQIAACLSSVLMKPLGIKTGTLFNPHCRTSHGKTIGLEAGVGCWGHPNRLGSANATANALENKFEDWHHMGIALDELEDSDTDMATLIYKLANGAGRDRMKSNAEAIRTREWQLNGVVSSEVTYSAMLEAKGISRKGGTGVRMVEFNGERWLPIIPLDDLTRFRLNLEKYYGTAGPELVRIVMRRWDELPAMFKEIQEKLYTGKDPAVRRVAASFAQLQMVLDLLDIDSDVVRETFEHWAGNDVETTDTMLQIAKTLSNHIDANLGGSLAPLASVELGDGSDGLVEGQRGFGTLEGWYDDERVYLLPAAVAKHCRGVGRNAFYQWLDERGVIELGNDGRRTKEIAGFRVLRGKKVLHLCRDTLCQLVDDGL